MERQNGGRRGKDGVGVVEEMIVDGSERRWRWWLKWNVWWWWKEAFGRANGETWSMPRRRRTEGRVHGETTVLYVWAN